MTVTGQLRSWVYRAACLVIGVSLLLFSFDYGPGTPFIFWPDAARSVIDHTIHGHLLRPSILWLAVLLLSAAAFWMAAMGWLCAWLLANGRQVEEHGNYGRRLWRPRGSWWFFALVLGAAAGWRLLVSPNTPGPGARETGRYEEVCDDEGYCSDAPVLELYRWGKPFLLRAERENIQATIALFVLWFPAGVPGFWLGERLKPVKSSYGPEHPNLSMETREADQSTADTVLTTAVRIFRAEAQDGYRDRVVIGGLAAFTDKLPLTQQRTHVELVSAVSALLHDYGSVDQTARAANLAQATGLLNAVIQATNAADLNTRPDSPPTTL